MRLLLPILLLAPFTASASPPGPVATVRVEFDARGETRAQVSGHADLRTARLLSADDPVRIASISKLVTAIGVMRLVEAGRLDLDTDVSRYLGWQLRHPAFPRRAVTLRQLLSHRAGLTDSAGYYGVAPGEHMRRLTDDPRAWDGRHAPGRFFRYANLGSPLVAAAMEGATGERFDRLMHRLVFEPLQLDACFNWVGCSPTALARAVVLYDAARVPQRDDLRGEAPPCPIDPSRRTPCGFEAWSPGSNGTLFSPQGGLRISARDLAKIGRLLLRGGELDGVRLLSAASVRELARPHWRYAPGTGLTSEAAEDASARGFFCRFGLGTQTLATRHPACRDDPAGDGRPRVGHAGSAYGLVSGLWIDRRHGRGVAYFATGVDPASTGAKSAFNAVEEALLSGVAPPGADFVPGP